MEVIINRLLRQKNRIHFVLFVETTIGICFPVYGIRCKMQVAGAVYFVAFLIAGFNRLTGCTGYFYARYPKSAPCLGDRYLPVVGCKVCTGVIEIVFVELCIEAKEGIPFGTEKRVPGEVRAVGCGTHHGVENHCTVQRVAERVVGFIDLYYYRPEGGAVEAHHHEIIAGATGHRLGTSVFFTAKCQQHYCGTEEKHHLFHVY